MIATPDLTHRHLASLSSEGRLNEGVIFSTQGAKMTLNSFVINKTSSKSSPIFCDFYRFLCAKRPFFAPKSTGFDPKTGGANDLRRVGEMNEIKNGLILAQK
jgi:hypothetical protein